MAAPSDLHAPPPFDFEQFCATLGDGAERRGVAIDSVFRRKLARGFFGPMNQLPLPARWYIVAVLVSGCAVISFAIVQLPTEPIQRVIAMFALAAAYSVAECWRLVIPRQGGDQPDFSLATAIAIWAALAIGPTLTVLTVATGYTVLLLTGRLGNRAWFKHLFNLGQLTLSYGAASWVYWQLADATTPVLGSLQNLVAFIPVFGVYYLLNTGFVSVVLALVRRESLIDVWRNHYEDTALIDLAMVPAGATFALLWNISPFAIVLAPLPLYVVYKCFSYIREMHEQTKRALFALSQTLDHRDSATFNHSETVATFARAIAERLGLPTAQIALIVDAARLHDIGKIGVRDSILLKNGPLTVEERQEMERHPDIAAEMIASFSVFQDGVTMVRHHHERWDGAGYPAGLRGEDIPLGSRIIFVADSFEAMTADRPYRKGMPMEVAARILAEGAGSQWDPRIVEVMLDYLADTRGVFAGHRSLPTPDITPAVANTTKTAITA